MKGLLIIGAIGFLYTLIFKPEIVAVFLFTLIVSDINFDLPGLPLNLRAIVSLALFVRVLIDNNKDIPPFFSIYYFRLILFFILYIFMDSWATDMISADIVKEFILKIMCVYLGYHFYYTRKNYSLLRMGVILAGFVCIADLAYTYKVAGGFPVQRIYMVYVNNIDPAALEVNHNFFGYICGIAFVFLFHDFLSSTETKKISILLMFLMFMGVLMSTSRSALVSMILIVVFLLVRAISSKKNGKKAYNVILFTIGGFFLTIFLFQILQTTLGLSNEFFEFITTRLIDEPLASLNKALGNHYNIQYMDSVEWREEASNLAYSVFINLKLMEQLFGIGYGGFIYRDYGYGFDAHNGLLLLLIETGVVGFLIYFSLIFGIVRNVIKTKYFSPLFTCVIFIIAFAVTHNKELTGFPAFLILGTLVGEIEYRKSIKPEPADESLPAIAEAN